MRTTARADPTWSAANIDTNADYALDVDVADMDGDGDLDIVSASILDDTIAWYESNAAFDKNLDTDAVAGVDYTAASGTLTFDAGDGPPPPSRCQCWPIAIPRTTKPLYDDGYRAPRTRPSVMQPVP